MSQAVIVRRTRAHFPNSKCGDCGCRIRAGETIALSVNGDSKWVCDPCARKVESARRESPAPAPAVDTSNLEARLRNAESTLTGVCDAIGQLHANAGRQATPVDGDKLQQLATLAEKGIRSLAKYDERLKALEVNQPKRIEVVVGDRPAVQLDGVQHCVFPQVLRLAAARKPVFLPGPAGCGKTHIAGQVAKVLPSVVDSSRVGLRFGFISCSGGMSEGHLTGRLLPTGDAGKFEFVGTEFLTCYEEGGVFLLDEMDAADPNVLLIVNSALANGHLALPNRVAKPYAERHPDFVLIAAANTFGTGADRLYVGRSRLDESTLDRFRIGTVPMDYDPEVEKVLCPNDELRERLTAIRGRVQAAKLERIVSTRFMRDAADMMRAGMTLLEVEAQLFSGWRADEIRKAKGE